MQGDLISVRLTEADGGETVLITDKHLYAADVDMHVLERIRTGPERRASELAARMVLQEICWNALPEQEQKHNFESKESEERRSPRWRGTRRVVVNERFSNALTFFFALRPHL